MDVTPIDFDDLAFPLRPLLASRLACLYEANKGVDED